MPIRALRGAITVSENSGQAILEATKVLLDALAQANGLGPEQVIAATFSVTEDLDQAYPAGAARALGWTEAALMCVQEMRVESALESCIRVCVLLESERPQSEMKHRYLGGAAELRKDLFNE